MTETATAFDLADIRQRVANAIATPHESSPPVTIDAAADVQAAEDASKATLARLEGELTLAEQARDGAKIAKLAKDILKSKRSVADCVAFREEFSRSCDRVYEATRREEKEGREERCRRATPILQAEIDAMIGRLTAIQDEATAAIAELSEALRDSIGMRLSGVRVFTQRGVKQESDADAA